MHGTNPALRSSVIAGRRTGIWTRNVTRTTPLTTSLASLTSVQASTQTPMSARCVMRRLFCALPTGRGDYINRLAHSMCAARCRAEKVDQFTKFIYLVATIDWSVCPTPSESFSPAARFHRFFNDSSSKSFRDRGHFRVFSATTEYHGCNLGADDLMHQPPYFNSFP
jgi:hypothetical protein